jgi:hypothetical protein
MESGFAILSGEDCFFFFFWEHDLLAYLLASIDSVQINNDEPSWLFRFNSHGMFAVKAMYSCLPTNFSPFSLVSSQKARVLSKV